MDKWLWKLVLPNGIIALLMALVSICANGCFYYSKTALPMDDPFLQLYDASFADPVFSDSGGAVATDLITLSCSSMPLQTLVRVLSDQFSVGIVYSSAFSSSSVTAEFKNSDFASVLNVLARQLECEIIKVGISTYYLGKLKPEDKGILVRKVFGFSDASLSQILQSLTSSDGRSSCFDSVVFVSDHESVLSRIASALDYLDSVQSDVWIIQLCFITLRNDALAEGGASVTTSGTLSYDVANNRIDLKDFNIDALFSASSASSLADIYSSPMFLMRDGSSARWQDGKRVPIPKKSVSEYGVVTTTGYDYVSTGFMVDCSVASVRGGGRVKLSCEISDILSYVESAPLTATTSYNFEIDVLENRLYLVGELSMFKLLDKQDSFFAFSGERGKTRVQLWLQCYKIDRASSALSAPEYPD